MKSIGTLRRGGLLLYLYPDGTMLPVIAGAYDPPPDEESDSGSSRLDDLLGMVLIDSSTGQSGVLTKTVRQLPGRPPTVAYFLQAPGRTALAINPGTILVDQLRNSFSVLADGFFRSTGKLTEDDAFNLFGGSAGSQGRDQAAQDLDRAQAAHLAAQEAIAREQLAQQRQESLLNSATTLAERRMAERAGAREQAVSLAGTDPFRLAARLQARPSGEGPTPYDVLKSNVRTVATQDIPQVGPQSTIADLEAAIAKMQAMDNQIGAVPFTQAPGMAAGGKLMAGGPDFTPTGYSVVVGEGQINGDEEILTRLNDGSVIVTPLIGNAATGVVLPPGPQTMQNAAQATQMNFGILGDQFNTLRNSMNGNYGITTTPSTSPAQFGGGYGQLFGPLTLEQGYLEALVPPEEAARLSNLLGQLPNPRNAANVFRYLNPAEQFLVKSAYQLAGVDPATFDALVNSGLITGPERRALAAA